MTIVALDRPKEKYRSLYRSDNNTLLRVKKDLRILMLRIKTICVDPFYNSFLSEHRDSQIYTCIHLSYVTYAVGEILKMYCSWLQSN